jgi:DNA mismatch repair protein MutH
MPEKQLIFEEVLQKRLKPYWGLPVGSLSHEHNKGHKGWAGGVLEDVLGVLNKNGCEADFPEWGIEVKTLPLSPDFRVLENTFLSKISLPFTEGCFHRSRLYQKIRCIFWVPLIGERKASLEQRLIGKGFLWQMTAEQYNIFEKDWEELTFFIRNGYFSDISAHLGQALHIRPKARSSYEKVRISLSNQITTQIVPIGFYLRRSFTQNLLNQHFDLCI